MKKIAARSALAVLLLVLVTGCQAMTGRTAGQNVDDATITATVKAKLTADKLSNFTRIDVDTTSGVVSLNGIVPDSQQKAHAEDLARRVDGVKRVINNLQVSNR